MCRGAGEAEVERIALRRAVAAITDDMIVVRPSRMQLLGPVIQLGLTALAVATIVLFLELAVCGVVVLTVIAVFLGPVATLGFVFAGSSMVVDRRKQRALAAGLPRARHRHHHLDPV